MYYSSTSTLTWPYKRYRDRIGREAGANVRLRFSNVDANSFIFDVKIIAEIEGCYDIHNKDIHFKSGIYV